MATRSTIGYETQDGGYVGVYCHYDGYPDNIAPQLMKMTWDEVTLQVNRALLQGGGRCLDECELETFNDGGHVEAITEWPSVTEEYAYRKRLDGTVECLSLSAAVGTITHIDLSKYKPY